MLAAITITITIIIFAPLFPYHEPTGEVYLPSPWAWQAFVDCLDLQGVAKARLCDFPGGSHRCHDALGTSAFGEQCHARVMRLPCGRGAQATWEATCTFVFCPR